MELLSSKNRPCLKMLTKIILIRHGQTDWNAEKKYCGFSDLGLNKQGKEQIGKLSRRLKNEDIYKVYSSDLKRAVQSAVIIFKKTKIEKVWDLREINFGILEGKSHKEILEIEPRIYQDWLNDPYSITIPKGESLNKFKKRVMGALEKIVISNSNKTVAVVCHGGTISIILSRINGSKNFWELIPGSASLNIIEYVNNKAKITLFNDISHLNV